jgi:hypothetical protein
LQYVPNDWILFLASREREERELREAEALGVPSSHRWNILPLAGWALRAGRNGKNFSGAWLFFGFVNTELSTLSQRAQNKPDASRARRSSAKS